ncbi:hypothetical protein TR51_17055 [Kitasatospora griseola]|uniref:Uncharacterized protein n=1 Tax=Kitasatospora griseola TaxID=2064 RepID=A0A0D0PZ09_KITGR|nr:hypothetical protein TR51_17055 [Kitasatospora griseola]
MGAVHGCGMSEARITDLYEVATTHSYLVEGTTAPRRSSCSCKSCRPVVGSSSRRCSRRSRKSFLLNQVCRQMGVASKALGTANVAPEQAVEVNG